MLAFPIPWHTFAGVEPTEEYLVMASHLPLRSYWKVPAFLRLTLAVQKQLAGAAGLVGYSLLAQPLNKSFFTLSAWRSQDQLDAFARALPHAAIMRELRPHMAPTTFTFWRTPGAALPLPWDEAMGRLRAAAGVQSGGRERGGQAARL